MGLLNRLIYLALAVFKSEVPMLLSSLGPPITSVFAPERVAYIIPLLYINFTWWPNSQFVSVLLVSYGVGTLGAIENLR